VDWNAWHWLFGFLGLVSLVASAVTTYRVVLRLFRAYNWLVRYIMDVDQKIMTLWGYHMARGHAEAVTKGFAMEEDIFTGEQLPPVNDRRLVLGDHLRARFAAFRAGKEISVAQELRTAYRTKHMTRTQLEMWIEREFRDWLIDNVCIPLSVHDGACIAFAMTIAKEE
jgi:hypothetical protein